MEFNSHATSNDIVSDIRFLLTGKYNGTIDYHINDITRNVNRKLDEVVSLILRSNSRWEWDDNNFATLPIGKSDLVGGQQDYEISGVEFLTISEVAVKNSLGDWVILEAIDRNKGTAQELTDLSKTANNGLPSKYDKLGNSIILYPNVSASNVTLSEGLRVVIQRPGSYFLTTDTTKQPGFNPLYHRILPIGASIDFCLANGLGQKKADLEAELAKLNEGLINSYNQRAKDYQPRLGLASEGDAESLMT